MFLQGLRNVNSSPDTRRSFFLSFFLRSHSHSRKSSACYVFLRQSCGGSSSPVRLGDSRRQHTICLFCYNPPKPSPSPPPLRGPPAAVDRRLISPKIFFFFFSTKATVGSKKSRRVTQSAETCRGVHWKDLVRRGAVVLISPQSKPSSVRRHKLVE